MEELIVQQIEKLSDLKGKNLVDLKADKVLNPRKRTQDPELSNALNSFKKFPYVTSETPPEGTTGWEKTDGDLYIISLDYMDQLFKKRLENNKGGSIPLEIYTVNKSILSTRITSLIRMPNTGNFRTIIRQPELEISTPVSRLINAALKPYVKEALTENERRDLLSLERQVGDMSRLSPEILRNVIQTLTMPKKYTVRSTKDIMPEEIPVRHLLETPYTVLSIDIETPEAKDTKAQLTLEYLGWISSKSPNRDKREVFSKILRRTMIGDVSILNFDFEGERTGEKLFRQVVKLKTLNDTFKMKWGYDMTIISEVIEMRKTKVLNKQEWVYVNEGDCTILFNGNSLSLLFTRVLGKVNYYLGLNPGCSERDIKYIFAKVGVMFGFHPILKGEESCIAEDFRREALRDLLNDPKRNTSFQGIVEQEGWAGSLGNKRFLNVKICKYRNTPDIKGGYFDAQLRFINSAGQVTGVKFKKGPLPDGVTGVPIKVDKFDEYVRTLQRLVSKYGLDSIKMQFIESQVSSEIKLEVREFMPEAGGNELAWLCRVTSSKFLILIGLACWNLVPKVPKNDFIVQWGDENFVVSLKETWIVNLVIVGRLLKMKGSKRSYTLEFEHNARKRTAGAASILAITSEGVHKRAKLDTENYSDLSGLMESKPVMEEFEVDDNDLDYEEI